MKKFRFGTVFQIGVAVALGSIVGVAFGHRTAILGEGGVLLIKVLKALAPPLVFFAILNGFSKAQIKLRSGFQLLLLGGMNAGVASAIAIFLMTFFPIGRWVGTEQRASLLSLASPAPIEGLTRANHLGGAGGFSSRLLDTFLNNNVVSVVIISVLVGIIFKKLKNIEKYSKNIAVMEQYLSSALQITSSLLGWIVKGVPLAVFGVVAKIVGASGFGFLSTLGYFVLLVVSGMLIHSFVYYSLLLLLVARTSPVLFFKRASEALMTALGTGSSLATLPVTLRTLRTKMNISPESSTLAACIGSNLNHDGILLYEAVAALFVAQIHGVDLVFSEKILILGSSALAAVGIAGVPDAGLITLSLVLGSVGLPVTLVPVLMTVDWLIGRFRAMTNVTSDMVVATLLDKIKG